MASPYLDPGSPGGIVLSPQKQAQMYGGGRRPAAATPQILSDYQAYWSNPSYGIGSVTPIWGGNLTKTDANTATWAGPGGQTATLGSNYGMDDLYNLAQRYSPIMQGFQQGYGNDVFQGYTPTAPATSATGGLNLPALDTLQGPQSWAGIDPSYKPNLTQWMQQLTGLMNPQAYQGYMNSAYNPAIEQMTGYWDKAREGLGDLYDSALKQRLQGGLNSLASRGIIGEGTPMSETLAREAGYARDAILDREQQINTAAAGALSNALAQRAAVMSGLPGQLGSLAGLTQASGSSTDLAPYDAYATLLQSLLYMQPTGATIPQATELTPMPSATTTNQMGRR